MLNLDRIVPIDDHLAGLAAGGKGAGSFEAEGSGLAPEEKLTLLKARLASSRNPDLAREVLAGAQLALARVGAGEAQFTLRETIGLEAVVDTVCRPSLSVQDGVPNLASTVAEKLFGYKLRQMEDRIAAVAAAVGRVNVPTAKGFEGTAIYIAEGRVATNRHVLEAIARQGPDGAWSLKWPCETTVDFSAEAGIPSEPGFRVVEVRFHGPDAIDKTVNFARLDLAVLDIEPIGDAAWPGTVRLSDDAPALGAKRWVYTLGFPGRPELWEGPGRPRPGYETVAVMRDLFDDEFDCKKLAPGRVLAPPATIAGDSSGWVFAHDCSTLGGNSGSAVVEFSNHGDRVLGIHFGGATRSQNWGHAFGPLRAIMEREGATYRT